MNNDQSRFRNYLLHQSGVDCKVQKIGNLSSISCPTVETNEKFLDFLKKKKKKVEMDKMLTDVLEQRKGGTSEFKNLVRDIKEFNDKRLFFIDDEINLTKSRIGSMRKAEQEMQKK